MNLDYLKTYTEVVKLRSFSKAGRKLHLSQPAVSFQMRRLEQELQVRLIMRDNRSFSVTNSGERLYHFALDIQRDHKKLLSDIDLMRQEPFGELDIIATPVPGEFILPPILEAFRERYPAIEITQITAPLAEVIEGIKSGAYKMGFCSIVPEKQDIESFKIGQDEIVLVVYPGHPFAAKNEVALNEIYGESLILREISTKTRQSDANILINAGVNLRRFKPKFILSTYSAIISLVEARAGIAFIPYLAVKKSEALGLLKVIKIHNTTLKREFFFVYRKDQATSPVFSEFIAFMRNYYQNSSPH
jgi:DNA-binding transcriptional LysR family regulator